MITTCCPVGDMIEVYKLLTGREQINFEQFFKPAQNHYDLRGHPYII